MASQSNSPNRLIIFEISDIHLEMRKNKQRSFDAFLHQPDHTLLQQYAPYETCLIIAGDLGYPNCAIYKDFLKHCTTRFNHVIVTSGNHEYYKQKGSYHSTQRIDDQIRQVCKEIGCVFLQKSVHRIPLLNRTISIAGCTLWSHIPKDKEFLAETNMNDFLHILTNNYKFWTSRDFNAMHNDHVDWLKKCLETEQIDIVVTHHLPTFDLIAPGFKNSPLNCCYASETTQKVFQSTNHQPSFWFCGHSHEHGEIVQYGTRFVLNPLGYPHERTTFQKNQYFVIQ